MPTNRSHAITAVYNGEIFVIGGHSDAFAQNSLTINEVYNIAEDSWTTKTSAPELGVVYSSAVLDDKLYIFSGGHYEDHTYIRGALPTQTYDLTTDSWSTGTPIPMLLNGFTAAATTGINASKRVYVLGGDQGGYGMNYTQVYDPKNDSWSTAADMPLCREMLTVACVNDVLYAIGGSNWFMYISELSNQQYYPVGYGKSDTAYSAANSPNLWIIPAFISICAVCAVLIFYSKNVALNMVNSRWTELEDLPQPASNPSKQQKPKHNRQPSPLEDDDKGGTLFFLN
jgi:N-acetylneuraminic acid mutarotase